MRRDGDVVVAGIGVVTSHGIGVARQLTALDACRSGSEPARPGRLDDVDLVGSLENRRLTRTIAFRDIVGLVALEDAARQARYQQGLIAASRVGLHVGAPPPHATDAEPFLTALDRSADASGRCDPAAFGRACQDVRPTVLLCGLPNNVLCYGSIILGAQGPNSNYVSGSVSGQLAVINALRAVRRGQVDLAFAGGYCACCDGLHSTLLEASGLAHEDPVAGPRYADGGVFVVLERRDSALERGVQPWATLVGATSCVDDDDLHSEDPVGDALFSALSRMLAGHDVNPAAVGLVCMAPSAPGRAFDADYAAVRRLFAGRRDKPAVAMLRSFGLLLEASGLLDIGLVRHLYASDPLPEAAVVRRASTDGFAARTNGDQPYALILSGSETGEHAALMLLREME